MTIPPDIIESARKVDRWMKENSTGLWELEGICSRDFASMARQFEISLRFIAEHGGTQHETECGTIHCNGSWCAEQARASLP